MIAAETRAVVAALATGGQTVRFVGGCVRDAVLGRDVTDVDIATPDPPDMVRDRLRAAGLQAIPTGIAHGTVTAISGHRPFEITSLRRDVETDGRHARVAYTDDWTEDAARRDFTFNAMFCDPDGTLYDPFDGRADLAAGRVRFVGDARTRITEDFLRLLRFFRFFAHYGAPPPDSQGLAACAELAPGLERLSGERLRVETTKLLAAPDPVPAVRLMRDHGVLAHLLPEASAPEGHDGLAMLDALVSIEQARADAAPLRRLAALLTDAPGDAVAIAARLKFSNADRDRLQAMLAPDEPFAADTTALALRRMLYRLGPERCRDRLLIAWAGAGAAREAAPAAAPFAAKLATIETWTRPRFPLAGKDVLALGVSPGAQVGQLLRAAERWWIAGDFQADRDQALAHLRAEIAQSRPGPEPPA
ncbi:MAG: CCA tRNA nucleotidyltransferase [Alphaproteobacteria bacterium]|jgi:poly(A) polymerase|nr:CCA tRNA nucleotidyltransferase [Alphaproteobacteria bacterium]